MGFIFCETVKLLNEKYQTTERNLCYNAGNRNTWQLVLTQLFDLDKARLMVINRYGYPTVKLLFNFQYPRLIKKILDQSEKLILILLKKDETLVM